MESFGLPLSGSMWNPPVHSSGILDFENELLNDDLYYTPKYKRYPPRQRTITTLGLAGQSNVKNEKFQVMLDVSHFKPNEVEIKVVDNSVVIHGKHEEKTDEHGFIQREFTRRYNLPEGTEAEGVKCSWRLNGILIIEAPKKAIEPPPSNERVVPITVLVVPRDFKI